MTSLSDRRRRKTDAATRQFLLQTKAAMTQRAGRDVAALCQDPKWLLTGVARRPIAELLDDLGRSADPEVARLRGSLLQVAHLLGGTTSESHRITTVLAWLSAEPDLAAVTARCAERWNRPYLRQTWAVRPGSAARRHTLQRHESPISSCVFLQGDDSLVSIDDHAVALLWDVASGSFVAQLNPEDAWRACGQPEQPPLNFPTIRISTGLDRLRALSGGTKQLALLTPKGMLAVWSVEEVPIPQYVHFTSEDGFPAAQFLFRVDDACFMTRSDGVFRLHRWADGRVELIVPVLYQSSAAAFDRNRQFFAVESDNGLVTVWNLRERRLVAEIATGRSDVSDLAVDAGWLMVVDDKGVGHVWDWRADTRLATCSDVFDCPSVDSDAGSVSWLRRPGELTVRRIGAGAGLGLRRPGGLPDELLDYGRAIVLRPEPGVLATVLLRTFRGGSDSISFEHYVDVFAEADGRRMAGGSGDGELLTAALGPRKGQILVVTRGGSVETWDPAAKSVHEVFTRSSSGPTTATISETGRTVAVSSYGELQLLRTEDQQRDAGPRYPLLGMLYGVVGDPSGSWVATVTDQVEVDLWSAADGRPLHRLRGIADHTFRNALSHLRLFSPTGDWILTGDWDSSILAWDARSGQRLPSLPAKSGDPVYATAGPHGPIVLTRMTDRSLTVWDLAQRRRLASGWPPGDITGDAHGQWIAVRGGTGNVAVWDLARWQSGPLIGHADGFVADPGGRALYVWDANQVRIWDAVSGRIATAWEAGDGPARVDRVVVSRDGRRCLLIRDDGEVISLGPDSVELAGGPILRGLTRGACLLSGSGRFLACSPNGTGHMHVIDVEQPRRRAVATVDGRIHGLSWIGDSAIAVIGTAGLQCLQLAHAPSSV